MRRYTHYEAIAYARRDQLEGDGRIPQLTREVSSRAAFLPHGFCDEAVTCLRAYRG